MHNNDRKRGLDGRRGLNGHRRNTFFFGVEFHEDGRIIDLISIGVVSGRTGARFYRESSEFDPKVCNDYVKANVLPRLRGTPDVVRTRAQIRDELAEFVSANLGSNPAAQNIYKEFWGRHVTIGWVAVLQLFGRGSDRPLGWPPGALELVQLLQLGGSKMASKLPPKLPPELRHDALANALWVQAAYYAARTWIATRENAVVFALAQRRTRNALVEMAAQEAKKARKAAAVALTVTRHPQAPLSQRSEAALAEVTRAAAEVLKATPAPLSTETQVERVSASVVRRRRAP